MKRKLLSIILCVTMAASLLAGCGKAGSEGGGSDTGGTMTEGTDGGADEGNSGDTDSAGTNEMAVEGDDYTALEVWTFIELHQQFYTDMAEKWNEENPDKKVKLVMSNLPYDDMHNKLSLALESGEGAPDVVDIELSKFPAFMVGNVGMKDLTAEIAPYQDKVVESRLDIYSKNGERYGFPTHVGATVAFYNDDLLQEAGIDYTAIKTWNDFKEAGVKYYETTGKYFAAVETSAQWWIALMVAQKGGEYLDESGNVNINNDIMAEVLTYLKELQDTGAFATVPGGQPDNEEAYPSYNNGDYAVQIMPFWQTSRFTSYMTDLSGQVAIAPCPVFEAGQLQSIGGGGTGTAIIKDGANADLAAEVFAYIKLSDLANEQVWDVLGFDPVNTAVWSDAAVTQNPENQYVQFFKNYPFDALNEIKDSIGFLDSYTDEKWPSINQEICFITLTNIFDNGMDIKEALDESQATLENEFQ